MEEYKKYVDHQHAPESLIADTIKKSKGRRSAEGTDAGGGEGGGEGNQDAAGGGSAKKEEKAVWKDHDGGNDGSSGSGGDRSAGAGLSRGR